MKNKKDILIISFLLLILILPSNILASSEMSFFEKIKYNLGSVPEFECKIQAKPNSNIEECNFVGMKEHACQIYGSITKYSSTQKLCEKCLKRSNFLKEYSEKCINYEIQESRFKKSMKEFNEAVEKGIFTEVQGKILIERGMEIITVKKDTILYAGDTVISDDNAYGKIKLTEIGYIEINKKTKFTMPSSENAAKRTSKITLFFGNLWMKAKNFLGSEEENYIKTPTDSGRRG